MADVNSNLEKVKQRNQPLDIPADESNIDVDKLPEENKHASQGRIQESYDAQARERGGKEGDQVHNRPGKQ